MYMYSIQLGERVTIEKEGNFLFVVAEVYVSSCSGSYNNDAIISDLGAQFGVHLIKIHLVVIQCLHYRFLTLLDPENFCSLYIFCGKDLGRTGEVLVVVDGKNPGSYPQELVVATVSTDINSVG